MATFAILSGNIVNTVIVADTVENARLATGNAICIEYTEENPAGIGFTYDEATQKFVAPIIPEQTSTGTVEQTTSTN